MLGKNEHQEKERQEKELREKENQIKQLKEIGLKRTENFNKSKSMELNAQLDDLATLNYKALFLQIPADAQEFKVLWDQGIDIETLKETHKKLKLLSEAYSKIISSIDNIVTSMGEPFTKETSNRLTSFKKRIADLMTHLDRYLENPDAESESNYNKRFKAYEDITRKLNELINKFDELLPEIDKRKALVTEANLAPQSIKRPVRRVNGLIDINQLEKLPAELILEIEHFLTPEESMELRKVNRQFFALIGNDTFKSKFRFYFPHMIENAEQQLSELINRRQHMLSESKRLDSEQSPAKNELQSRLEDIEKEINNFWIRAFFKSYKKLNKLSSHAKIFFHQLLVADRDGLEASWNETLIHELEEITLGNVPLLFLAFNLASTLNDKSLLDFFHAKKPAVSHFDKWVWDLSCNQASEEIQANANCHGLGPLHYAVLLNRIDLVKSLIDGGMNINAQTSPSPKDSELNNDFYHLRNYRATPLHLAVLLNRPEIVKVLLDKNADINARDSRGFTPFTVSVLENKSLIRNILHGDSRCVIEQNALSNAVYKVNQGSSRHLESVKFICQSLAADNNPARQRMLESWIYSATPTNRGDSMFYTACVNNIELATVLATYGSDARRAAVLDTEKGVGLLIAACYHNNYNAVSFLLANGANVNCTIEIGKHRNITPLYIARQRRSVELVKLLVKNKADFSIERITTETDHKGWESETSQSCLELAMERGNKEIIEAMLDQNQRKVLREASPGFFSHLFGLNKTEALVHRSGIKYELTRILQRYDNDTSLVKAIQLINWYINAKGHYFHHRPEAKKILAQLNNLTSEELTIEKFRAILASSGLKVEKLNPNGHFNVLLESIKDLITPPSQPQVRM